MPQVRLEYSAALEPDLAPRVLAGAIHRRIVAFADGDAASCKTRLLPLAATLIGDGAAEERMVHVEVALLSGRSQEQKRRLAAAILADLEAATAGVAGPLQRTVEIRDMDRDSYAKSAVPAGA